MPSATVQSTSSLAGENHITGRGLLALVSTLIVAVLAYQLNSTMVTPSLPTMARSFGVDANGISPVTSLFFLAGALAGVLLTRWSDFIGRKRMLLIELGILLLGTLTCVFAPTLPILLVGRILQGAAGAVFQLAYIILNEAVNARTFGILMGFVAALNGGVAGIDGWLGGLLSDRWGFRSIFDVVLILVILAAVAVWALVPGQLRSLTPGTMDWRGGITLAVGLIFAMYFVNRGASDGWLAPTTLLLLLGGTVAMVAYYRIEKRSTFPLFPVESLRTRQTWPLIATTILSMSSIFAVINFTIAIVAQDKGVGFRLDAATAALLFLTTPAAIGFLSAPISGWLAGKIGWLTVLRSGLAISITAITVIGFAATNKWVVFAMIALLGISYNGMILTTINGLGVLLSPPEAPGALPGLNGAGFSIGAGLGIGLVAPFVARATRGGYETALWTSLGIAVLALLTSLILRPRQGQKI